MWKLTPEQKGEICQRYKEGKSGIDLANEFGVFSSSIYGILHRRGIAVRSYRKAAQKYELDETVFDIITEEGAYWIGFLMADGCITLSKTSSPTISLQLSVVDKEHIYKFRSFLKSSHKISIYSPNPDWNIYTRKPIVRFSVRSEKLAARLSDFGIVPTKTKHTQIKNLESNRHFWRGVIDGDGYIGISSRNEVRLELWGSFDLLNQFFIFAHNIVPQWKGTISKPKSANSYRTSLWCNQAIAVVHALYTDCSISLERKLEMATQILST